MRAFVTGATGFIGGRLAGALRARGDDVVALVRSGRQGAALAALGCELVEGDLASAAAIARGVAGCDALFHAAADYRIGVTTSEAAAMREVNVGGTERVLDAAAAAGVGRIVHVSTVNAFGDTRGDVVDETYRRPDGRFVSVYDETRCLAQVAAEERIARGAPCWLRSPASSTAPATRPSSAVSLRQAQAGTLRYVPLDARLHRRARRRHIAGCCSSTTAADDRRTCLGGELTRLRELRTAARAAEPPAAADDADRARPRTRAARRRARPAPGQPSNLRESSPRRTTSPTGPPTRRRGASSATRRAD